MVKEAHIGERVRRVRQERGLSQEQLAELCGAKQQSIQVLEKGEVHRPRYVMELAKALKVNGDWLVHGEGKSPPKRQTKATKGTLKPLEENDPVFRRGPVNYSPGLAPNSGKSKISTSGRVGTSTRTPDSGKPQGSQGLLGKRP